MGAKKVFISLVVILSSILLTLTESAAATHNAASCSYADVSAKVSAAISGDTIIVPTGNCTWSSSLTITKGINLIGAGTGQTTINGSNRGDGNFLIAYNPAVDNQVFRVSGFTFNITEQQAILLVTNSEPTTQTNIRIDHNRFTNSSISRSAIMNYGCFGVIDNNTFDNLVYPLGLGNSLTGSGQAAWLAYSDDFFGTSSNLYVEDNTFNIGGGQFGAITDCDQGGRYAVRYNTISVTNDFSASWPLFDTHEWGTSGYGCMGAEVYGNITDTEGFLLSSQGAGRDTFHHNIMPASTSDSTWINLYSDGGGGCSPALPERQKMNNNYFFQNRVTTTGALISTQIPQSVCPGLIVENQSFWKDNTSFNGTSGVGCGTLASRPSTCTQGVGYWATNQSCTNLTGMVGAKPTTPISGTLYKCTTTDTWTAFFTPLTYPHPLTTGGGGGGGTDTMPPAPPTSVY